MKVVGLFVVLGFVFAVGCSESVKTEIRSKEDALAVAEKALSTCSDVGEVSFVDKGGIAIALSKDRGVATGVKPLIQGDPKKFSIILVTKELDPYVICIREWMGYDRASKVAKKLNVVGGGFASYVLGFPVVCTRVIPAAVGLYDYKFGLLCDSVARYGLSSPKGACKTVFKEAASIMCAEAY